MKENSSGKKVAIRSDSDGIIASDRTDEELRKCESRHHAILQTAMDGFWLVNLQGRIMEVNEAYCKMSGYTSVELLTMSITDLDVKESRVDTAAHIQKIVVNGKDRFVSRQRHKNGSIFDVEVSVQFYQEAGVLFAFLRDVTASNRVEEDLRKNEALMRTALKNLPIIFYMIDRDGIFRLSIGAGLKGLGLEQNQVVGLSAFDVYKDFPEITDSIKTTLSGKAATFETTVSGSTYFNTCVPFFTPSKEFSGLVAVALDITEIKKAETALTQSEDRFRRAIENAPFPIMLHAENGEVLALSEGWTHDSGYTIDDIPTTSIWSERAYGTKKQIVKEEIDVLYGLEHRKEEGEYSVTCKNGSLKIWDFSSAPMGKLLDGRRAVISMAKDVTYRKHPSLAKGDYVKITIKDCGIGIPKDLVSKIFDPFFTTKTKGHGLGLATCHSIVNRHGGAIDVESEPGKGSAFHVYLPATREDVSADTIKTAVNFKGAGTFIVMDDEEVMRETIGDMLRSFGYAVVSKKNGKEAVEFFMEEIKAKRQVAGMIFDLAAWAGRLRLKRSGNWTLVQKFRYLLQADMQKIRS